MFWLIKYIFGIKDTAPVPPAVVETPTIEAPAQEATPVEEEKKESPVITKKHKKKRRY